MDESDEGMFVVDLRLEDMAIEVTCSKVLNLDFLQLFWFMSVQPRTMIEVVLKIERLSV